MADKDRETSLYLTQICDLVEQLDRRQRRCDELKDQNRDVVLKLRELKQDMEDDLEWLQDSLSDLEKEEQELTEGLEKQLQADKREEDLELKLNQEKQELQERADQLSCEVSERAAQLEDLEEQSIHLKQKLFKNVPVDHELLQLQLRQKRESEELKNKQEKTRKEEQQKKKKSSVKIKVSAVVLKEGPERQRTSRELQLLTDENFILRTKIVSDQEEVDQLCVKINELKKSRDEVSSNICSLKKDLDRWTRRCQLLKDEIRNLDRSKQKLLECKEANSRRLASLLEDCRQKASEVAGLEAQLQKERSDRRKVEREIQKGNSVLTTVVTDSEKVSDGQLMMEKVLDVLELLTLQETGTSNEESTKRTGEEPRPQTSGAEAASTETDPLFLLAERRPCDLDYQPGPTWRPGAAATSLRFWFWFRRSLPPIEPNLWSVVLEKWRDDV